MTDPCLELAVFIREHPQELLADWEHMAAVLPANRGLPRPALRDEFDRIVRAVAGELENLCPLDPRRLRERAVVVEHALERADIGASLTTITVELFALRDAVERHWPRAEGPEASAALLGLRCAVERVAVASIERLSHLGMAVLDSVDAVVRHRGPGETVDQVLTGMLRALRDRIDGVDTVAVLLREEGDRLRVRAAVGPEQAAIGFTVNVGEGFSGLVAAERKPRLLRQAALSSVLVNPSLRDAGTSVLYGIPLCVGSELIGVAHMGSFSRQDFSEVTRWMFRGIMDRVARVIHEDVLREGLAVERARYQAVVDNAPTIIFSKDLRGRYLTINARALTSLHLAPEAFVGRTDYDVFPREVADAMRESDRRVFETRSVVERQERVRHDTETRVFLVVKYPILDARGRVAAIGGVATDVTDRERWRVGQELLAEAGGLLVSSLDCEDTLARVASRVVRSFADCTLLQLADDDGALHAAAVDHRDPEKLPAARALAAYPVDRTRPHLGDTALDLGETVHLRSVSGAYLDTMSQGDPYRRLLDELGPTSMVVVPLAARDRLLGVWLFVRAGGEPFEDQDAQIAAALGWRASLAIDNAHLHDAARRAIRSRDEVLGVVAHDLRNPLEAVLLGAETLRQRIEGEGPEAKRQRRALDVITRSGLLMRKLVSDLLDQYAIDRGEITVTVTTVPARALVDQAAESLRGRVERAGLSFEVDAPAALPSVRADADRVQQVFGNLIANAVKFTPAGGRITLGAVARDGEIEFSVTDTGPGFDPEVTRHLFEPEHRVRSAEGRGVGLGLVISRGIVQAHGGRLWIASEPGRGSTVSFTLPEPHGLEEQAAPTVH